MNTVCNGFDYRARYTARETHGEPISYRGGNVAFPPLVKAAIPGPNNPINRELFDLLLAAGANPNIGSEPPLHIAVVRGHRELVAYLIANGADPNLDDADGSPPFWSGVYEPDIKTMLVLIKLGADLSRRDGVGQTVEDALGKMCCRRLCGWARTSKHMTVSRYALRDAIRRTRSRFSTYFQSPEAGRVAIPYCLNFSVPPLLQVSP